LAQRSRKRGRRKPAAARARSAGKAVPRADRPARPSGEERNAAVRASLAPLAPGERPWPLKVAVVVAVVLGVVNLILFIAGAKPHVGGQKPQLPEILIFSGLMLMCGAGMWALRYWAVLGFQTLLAIGVLGFCLALVRVSNVIWALVCVIVIAAGGYLFYKLVRVLSRLQMPTPPGR
jgi:hypothetical protein